MKKHLYLSIASLSALFLIMNCDVSAQIKKGDVLLGGDLGFSAYKNAGTNVVTYKNHSFTFSPSIGWATRDNRVVGLNMTLSHAHGENPSTSNNTDLYGAGVFLRQYKPLGSGFSVFLQGRATLSYSTNKIEYPGTYSVTDNTKNYGIDLAVDPGIAYAITKRVQLETGFYNLLNASYVHTKADRVVPGYPASSSRSTGNAYAVGTSLSNALESFIIGFRLLI